MRFLALSKLLSVMCPLCGAVKERIRIFNTPIMLESIPLAKIQLRKGTQPRYEMQQDAIDEYAGIYRADPAKLPPLEVFLVDHEFVLADGFHRFHAAEVAGLKYLKCNVHRGTFDDALHYALQANRSHGVRRSSADKRRCVEMALEAWPKLSNKTVADLCSVGDDLVADVKKTLQAVEWNQPRQPNVTTPPDISGTKPSPQNSRVVSEAHTNSPPKTNGKLQVSPPEVQSQATRPAPMSTKKETKPVILDATGTKIPDEALPFWARRDEVQQILTEISRIKGVIEKAKAGDDPLFGVVSNGVIVHLEQAYTHFADAKPYAVCTQCMGSPSFQPKGCALCGSTGMISKYKWDHVSRKEVKEMRAKASAK